MYRRPAEEPARLDELQALDLRTVREPTDYTQALQTLLTSANLCSREWIYRQYDQFVGGGTVVRPGGDAAVDPHRRARGAASRWRSTATAATRGSIRTSAP